MRIRTVLMLGLFPLFLSSAGAQDVIPRDLSVEQSSAWSSGVPRPGSLRVSVNADRADATYAIGETARLFIRSNEDAYVNVFSIGPTGQVHQLFPNAYQRDSRVQANQNVEIAPSVSGARIAVSGPAGTEVIKVVASNRPLTVIAESQLKGREFFRSVEGGAQTLARNLEVVGSSQTSSETKIAIQNYTLKTVAIRSDNAAPGAIVVIPGQPAPASAPTFLPVVAPTAGGAFSVPQQQPFPLLVAVDKPAYKISERVTLAVTSLQACNLTVLNVTTSGVVRVLFPNQMAQNNAIAANQTVLIAGGMSNVTLQVAGPAGIEQIVAVCSTDQRPILTQKIDLAQLFPPAGERSDVARDLTIAAGRPAGTTSIATTSFAVQQ